MAWPILGEVPKRPRLFIHDYGSIFCCGDDYRTLYKCSAFPLGLWQKNVEVKCVVSKIIIRKALSCSYSAIKELYSYCNSCSSDSLFLRLHWNNRNFDWTRQIRLTNRTRNELSRGHYVRSTCVRNCVEPNKQTSSSHFISRFFFNLQFPPSSRLSTFSSPFV